MNPSSSHPQQLVDRILSTTVPKAPRKQAHRACEWCRVRRIRCDNSRPCRNCRIRGADCTNTGSDDVRTLPHALEEIQRLRRQVKLLQSRSTESAEMSHAFLPEPTAASERSSSSTESDLETGLGFGQWQWEGIYTTGAQSNQKSYFGPSSTLYFISRIASYLDAGLAQPFAYQNMQIHGPSKAFSSPTGLEETVTIDNSSGPVRRDDIINIHLSRTQEDYYLSLFWESFNCTFPIMDETEFRDHYASLWQTPHSHRKQSALVDIVLAISMQYGLSSMPRDTPKQEGRVGDASIAGRWYYRKCQLLLAHELENPSITVLQCHIYSFIYLCSASFQNMAHTTIAIAVRTAQILGLHLEPPRTMKPRERELRKRLWWTVFSLESKSGMKLGRPFSVQPSQVSVTLPADSTEAASLLGGVLGSYGQGVTWLTYAVQFQKLMITSRNTYCQIYAKFDDMMMQRKLLSPYNDHEILEICAELLSSRMQAMHDWVAQLPDGIKNQRRSGSPYSFDRTPLNLDFLAPLWLQRQRAFLELIYHTMCINLYRLFITFAPPCETYTPNVQRCTVACINHALTHTSIMKQVLDESDILNGWLESFQWQWNATITTIGFVIANPVGPHTSAARASLDDGIAIFDEMGKRLAVAVTAAAVTREMTAKADLLVMRFQEIPVAGPSFDTTGPDRAANEEQSPKLDQAFNTVDNPELSSQLIDWAFAIDAFNDFENFYLDTSPF